MTANACENPTDRDGVEIHVKKLDKKVPSGRMSIVSKCTAHHAISRKDIEAPTDHFSDSKTDTNHTVKESDFP